LKSHNDEWSFTIRNAPESAELAPSSIGIPEPVVVVEVRSRSTRRIDLGLKLAGYFRLASLVHYLIIDPDQPLIIQHTRQSTGSIVTQIVTQGTIVLDPPGLSVPVAEIYGG
jgi:Uma2 family endonuclease